jgi:putative endonuclease
MKKTTYNTRKSGTPGEVAAVHFLKQKGFIILEQNWRFKRAEIDIIARENSLLVFVEVKSRTKPLIAPELAVSHQQEQRLADAAGEYMMQQRWEGAFRFDIVSVYISNQAPVHLVHYEDAFFPGHH